MSLPHVILGFLNYAPATGYDLKKTFDATVRHFWPADQSQIYRTLARLVNDGAASLEEIPQSGKPARKLYHITDKGRSELMNWLREFRPPENARNPSLIQVFFGGNLNDDEMLGRLEKVATGLRAELEIYGDVPSCVAGLAPIALADREKFFWMLTLEYGLAVTRAELEWLESVISRIRRRQFTNDAIETGVRKKTTPRKRRAGNARRDAH